MLYQYGLNNNKTMQDIYKELSNRLKKASKMTKWNITEVALDFLDEKTGQLNESKKLVTKFNDAFRYVIAITRFYHLVITYPDRTEWANDYYGMFFLKDWIIENNRTDKNLGSIFIKNLNLMMNNINDITYSCFGKKYFDQFHKLFTIPGQNVSLIDIAYIYSLIDFNQLSKNTRFSKNDKDEIWGPPPSLVSIKNSFLSCFKDVTNNDHGEIKNDFDFYEYLAFKKYSGTSPCTKLEIQSQCTEYCNWHKRLFNALQKEEFLTIMRYALPQRKIILDPILPYEQKLAEKLFGPKNLKTLTQKLAPSSMAVFCFRNDVGFLGDDLGVSEKVCDDFFPSPTDDGMCLTRSMDIKNVLHRNSYFDTIFEADEQPENEKMDSRSLWSKTSMVIFTDEINKLRQTYPQKMKTGVGEIQFQLHQSKELGSILASDNDFTTSFTLTAGNEYYIRVAPTGQISTDGFRNLDIQQRNCLLDQEISKKSIFKKYSINNCIYECHVELSKDQCQCIPWDFIDTDSNIQDECDVFGRKCFFNAMENLTRQFHTNHCDHCIKECDFVKFNKEITKEESLTKMINHGDVKGKYISYESMLGNISGNKPLKEFIRDNDNIFADEGTKNIWNTFAKPEFSHHPKEHEYGTKRFDMYRDLIIIHLKFMQPQFNQIDVKQTTMDKFANFGGNFGIFAEITGVSFLGILNFLILFCKMLYSSRHQ